MKKIAILVFIFFLQSILHAQVDSLAMLKEVAGKLQTHSAIVSDILTNKKYSPIHPVTEFRDLIMENSSIGIVKITTPDEPGRKIRVLGNVTNGQGQPMAGALVYLYQTDYRGWYSAASPHVLSHEGDMRHARLFGYVKTDAQGRFELQTVKPSGYPQSDLPAHIHVHVTMPGYKNYITEFLFDDDTRLNGKIRENAIQNKSIIAKPETAPAPFEQQFSYHIIVEKQ